MSRLKLLVVIESLGRGGAERALVNLLPSLERAGIHCEVAALWGPYPLATELEGHGIAVHCLNLKSWNLLQGMERIASIARRGGFDVIHAHIFFAGIYTAVSKMLAPQPRRVVTFHNLGYDSYPANTLKRKAVKKINGVLLRNCVDAATAVSAKVAEHYQHHLGLSNIRVIPNAVAVPAQAGKLLDRATVFSRFGLDPKRFTFILAGRFVPEKGHRYLIEAAALLRDGNSQSQILCVGDGPGFEAVRREIQSRALRGLVTLHSSIAHDELMEIMGVSDAFVMSSTHEGSPLAPIEALLLSKPVVATAVGGIPELIENEVSGLLVEPANAKELADKMRRVMDDSDLRTRLGANGLIAARKLTIDAVAPQWVSFYDDLMKGHPRANAAAQS